MRRKKFADRWHSFKKNSFKLVFAALIVMIYAAFDDLFYHGSRMGISSLFIYLAAIIVFYVFDVEANDECRFSRYDDYIIRDSFKGLDPASRKFRKAVDLLLTGEYFTLSLEILQEVKEYDLKEREQAVLFYYLGIVYREMGYPTNAAVYFESSADIEILHPAVLLNAERSYAAAGNTDKAEEIIDRMYSLEYDKKYYDFLETDRGRIYLNNDNAEKALEIYSAAYENGLDRTGAVCGIAISYLLLGDAEKSKKYYRTAAVKPDYLNQHGFEEYYGHIARSCGLYDQVKDILRTGEQDSTKDSLSD